MSEAVILKVLLLDAFVRAMAKSDSDWTLIRVSSSIVFHHWNERLSDNSLKELVIMMKYVYMD